MKSYFISRDGRVLGPFSRNQIEAGTRNRKLRASDKIAPSRDGPWAAVSIDSPSDGHAVKGDESHDGAEQTLVTLNHKFEDLRTEFMSIVAALRQSVASLELQIAALRTPAAIECPAGHTSGDAPLTDSTIAGNWAVEINRNPLDDSVVFSVTSPAVTGVNPFGDAPTIFLVQRGEEGDKAKSLFSSSRVKIEVLIVWGAYFSDDDLTVRVRIGDSKPVRQKWGALADNTGTYYLGDARSLIRDIAKAGVFTVEARPYDENPIAAVFDCSRLSRAVIAKAPQLASWFM